MPEMPEVETIARRLRKHIVGKRIACVRLSGLELRKPLGRDFAAKLPGHKIRKILRRGKYIVLELDPKAFWLIHLGMSGRVLYHVAPQVGGKHTHVIVRFSDATELEYRDPRRFGLMAFYEVRRLSLVPEVRSLGKEPLDAGFNGEWLESQLKKCRQEIKSYLLDQRKIAGLGNIYASESLFLARIHPQRRCFTLTGGETKRLADAIREVMRISIRRRGTSFSDFVDSDGNPGENQNHLLVFQRDGQKCLRCKTPIDRFVQGNRSTFYCRNCQRIDGG
ncbi:MAG TPA: bifunctional DNA-formamidopyrimidine glycosylase/DNA-(apurinic or apyrimidinic site) lyase [Acidobacteriota bacterium]|nr:bifunctional DNA-formamidopyrimidine glycosylase/DNA-(apurinic or apyrimidinic site) lyase [Acidobacteriota bacterium]